MYIIIIIIIIVVVIIIYIYIYTYITNIIRGRVNKGVLGLRRVL
jgi:hypothetical protein